MSAWKTKHIEALQPRPSASGKTSIWDIVARRNGAELGAVRWFGRWRRYAFYPAIDTVFEQTCLREIANFCEHQTGEHNR